MTTREPADPRALLRGAGLRVTAPRLAMLEALLGHPHVDTDTAVGLARERVTLSTQTGYDVLGALTRAGLARRIEPAGRPALYEARVGDNHHHVVCRTCGRVEDIDCVVGARPCLDPSDDRGFDLDEAEITFWGLCPDCKAAKA